MATSGQPLSAQLPPLPNVPKDMSALCWSLCGAVHLAPKITRHVINYECRIKADSDNYRVYAENIRGKIITDEEWKNWCSFSGSQLKHATNPSKLDMTALNCLLDALWKVKKEVEIIREKVRLPLTYVHDRPMEASSQTDDIPGLLSVDEAAKKNRPSSPTGERKATARSITTPGQSAIQIQLKNLKTVRNVSVQAHDITWVVHEVKNVKNIRNAIVHSETFARDPASFVQVVSALKLVIRETRESYCLSATEGQKLEKNLDDEIYHLSSLNKTSLSYVCAAVLGRGKEQTKDLWQQKFTHEQMMFDNDKVKRQAVFYALEVMLRNERSRNVLPYTKLLEAAEQFIVVSGLAGSGKTTLLKNITLQFFELNQANADYLKAFSLLVYIDCKDRTTKTLSEVIEQQLEDLCREFTKELVVSALFRLDVLFLVDAFDEANSNSMLVLEELVTKAWRINCRVIFTSRPQSAKLLCQLLAKHDARFIEYEILPLTALEDQLAFLERLGNFLENAEESEAMQLCFSELNSEVRRMFTEPINLVLFCHLFRYLPHRIPQLQNPAQVAQEVFVLYRTLIEEKLIDSGYTDLSVVIDDQFLIVGELALQLLGEGVLTFTEVEFLNLQRLCKNKLNFDVDTQVFLSVVLKLHRPLAGKGSISWTFLHKTLQERFAARYVVKKIKDTKEPVVKVLDATKTSSNNNELATYGGSSPKWLQNLRQRWKNVKTAFTKSPPFLQPYFEVLLYVIQDLSANHPWLLERRWPELKRALQDSGVSSYGDWQLCMMSCPGVMQLAKQAAEATLAHTKTWEIRNENEVAVVAAMLPHAQPRLLTVVILPSLLRSTPWAEVVMHRVGDLSFNLCKYFGPNDEPFSACDDLVTPLLNSRSRLVYFNGCLGSDAGIAALSSVSSALTEQDIWLQTPLQLMALEGKYNDLTVHSLLLNGDEKASPLPEQPPPSLNIYGPKCGLMDTLAHTIKTFAPTSKRYSELRLHVQLLRDTQQFITARNEVISFSKSGLDLLVKNLQQRGIRTAGKGRTRWETGWLVMYFETEE